MSESGDARPVATLWQLSWNGDRVDCTVYRDKDGLQLRLESPSGVILSEPFDLQPQLFAKTHALRASLKRRGWQDVSSPPARRDAPPR